MIEQLQALMKTMEDGHKTDAEASASTLNKATVVSDENMEGIEAHVRDMNNQNYRIVSAIGRGNHIMLFWEKFK